MLSPWSFRIGCMVNLQVRLYREAPLEGAATTATAARQPGYPTSRTQGSPGTDGFRRIWSVAESTSGELGAGASASPTSRGPALVGDPTDQSLLFASVLPRKVKWKNNARRVPDELEVELPLSAFPFPADGSIVRSVLVEMWRGLIDPDDWARAMNAGGLAGDGAPVNVPLATDGDPDFVGFADTHSVELGGKAGTVTLRCRDISSVLGDEKCLGRHIETEPDMAADEAIARFLSLFPAAVGLEVHWIGSVDPPTPGDAIPKAKRPKAPKKGKKGKRGAPRPVRPDQTTALEAIATYCTLCGITPNFVGYRLELGPVRTLDRARANELPRMVLGVNLDSLELQHRLSGQGQRPIEVRSFNPDTGQTLIARWPDDPNRFGAMAAGATFLKPPSGHAGLLPGKDANDGKGPLVMDVEAVTSPAQLRSIARNVYDEMVRQDVTAKFVTRDIATLEGRARGVADLLALRAGDAINVCIAPTVEEASGSFVQRLAQMERGDAIEMLVRHGYAETVAARVVDGALSVDRPCTYRVREFDFTWGLDGGSKTEASLINYIEVRTGGNREQLRESSPKATAAQKKEAIEADLYAGELAPKDAAALRAQVDLADAEGKEFWP